MLLELDQASFQEVPRHPVAGATQHLELLAELD